MGGICGIGKSGPKRTHMDVYYIDWYFSTIFVDNLVTYMGYQPYIS